jgi:hypothetical protein
MNFTELELILMLAAAFLVWVNTKLEHARSNAMDAANKYAYFLMKIGKGEGTVINEGDHFRFQEIYRSQGPTP